MKLEDIKNATLIWGMATDDIASELKEDNDLVIVPENRPYLIGLKHNAPLLKSKGVRFIYCTDNTLGLLFYKNKIKKVIIFCKEIGNKGITGICGSLYAALLGKLHDVPIEIYMQENSEVVFQDNDSARLEGKNFIMQESKEDCIIEAKDEFIETEVLV